VRFVIEFPATVRVYVQGAAVQEDEAFAQAIEKCRSEIKAGNGTAVSVAYRKGQITERTPDPDPRD
jgi:hypothetical protein